MICQLLTAPNDRNGNPRRLWVFYDATTGSTVKVVDEGYAGLPPESRAADTVLLPSIPVTPAFYLLMRRGAASAGYLTTQ